MTPVVSITPAPGRWPHVFGHLRYAFWLAFHKSAPLPVGCLAVPVPLSPHGARGAELDALRDIADRLRVTEQRGDGVLIAERRWGALTVRAQLVDEDYTRQFASLGQIDAVFAWSRSYAPGGAA